MSEGELDGTANREPAVLVNGQLLVVVVLSVFAAQPEPVTLWQLRLPNLEMDTRAAASVVHSRAPDTEIVRSRRSSLI